MTTNSGKCPICKITYVGVRKDGTVGCWEHGRVKAIPVQDKPSPGM